MWWGREPNETESDGAEDLSKSLPILLCCLSLIDLSSFFFLLQRPLLEIQQLKSIKEASPLNASPERMSQKQRMLEEDQLVSH